MRNVLMTLVVVGLLAAPSLAVINVGLASSKTTMNVGDTAVITVSGQGTTAGLFSLAGNITASGASALTSTGPFAWVSSFSPTFGLTANNGVAGVNGGWSSFGSQQTNYLTPDATFAKAAPVALASYTVTATAPGQVTLSFVNGTVGGYKPVETDKSSVIGTLTPVTITVTPEPVTMALLALGGLVVARRRR